VTSTTLDTKVHDFLAQKRIAVAGVSRDNRHHPVGNLICRRLKKTGHDVFPVNPHMQTFDGGPCYPDLQSIPGGVDGVVIATRPEVTKQIVHQCDEAGVRRVWMHQSMMKGSSVSPAAVDRCRVIPTFGRSSRAATGCGTLGVLGPQRSAMKVTKATNTGFDRSSFVPFVIFVVISGG
jgi:predicted CoA-binding protein